jgi:hypothetical protein
MSIKLKDLELKIREPFTECLVRPGIFRKDRNLFTLSREEIERHTGE